VFQVPGSKFQVPSSKFQVQSSKFKVQSSKNSVAKIQKEPFNHALFDGWEILKTDFLRFSILSN
jgi:hypothetical protein